VEDGAALKEALPLLIPLLALQLGLMAFALYDLVRRERVRGGSKLLWGVVIVLFGILGPVVYFVVGRVE
jgi:hypothetical protein